MCLSRGLLTFVATCIKLWRMALLTTLCSTCQRVALVDEKGAIAGHLGCSQCGTGVIVLPGCSFASNDRGLFDELLDVVSERNVQSAEAKTLAAEIARALQGSNDTYALLDRLTTRWPGLWPTQAAAGKNEQARRRALRLLRAVLEAKGLESPRA